MSGCMAASATKQSRDRCKKPCGLAQDMPEVPIVCLLNCIFSNMDICVCSTPMHAICQASLWRLSIMPWQKAPVTTQQLLSMKWWTKTAYLRVRAGCKIVF